MRQLLPRGGAAPHLTPLSPSSSLCSAVLNSSASPSALPASLAGPPGAQSVTPISFAKKEQTNSEELSRRNCQPKVC